LSPTTWLLGSAAGAVLATNLAWLALRHNRHAAGWRIVAWLATALFFILPPVAAWLAGALSPYYLGISDLDWIPGLMSGAPVALAIIIGLLVGWLAYRRTLPRPVHAVPRDIEQIVTAARAPLDAALRQWHWAFYRALAIAWVARWAPVQQQLVPFFRFDPSADPFYWGCWLGLLLIVAEWALNPFVRAALRDEHDREAAVRQLALVVATTALFASTRNLWLGLLCHVAVETIIVGWLARPGIAPETTPQTGN